MKRILALILAVLTVLSCAGCAIFPSVLLKIKPEKVSYLKIERVSDGLSAEYEAEDVNISKFITAVNEVLFYHNGQCDGKEDHVFSAVMKSEKGDFLIYINADGSLCVNDEHYSVDFSSKSSINLSKISRWIDAANVKEEEVEDIEDTEESEVAPAIEKEELDPQEIADSIIKLKARNDITTVNGVSYFIGEAEILGEICKVIASTTEDDTVSIFYKAPLDSKMTYVENSYEQSGGKTIFINVEIPAMGIACFAVDLANNKAVNLSSGGSTSSFVMFDTPEAAIIGLGWMITDNAIVPITLANYTVDTVNSYNITEDAMTNVINHSFFGNFKEGYDNKKVELVTEGNNYLIITVTEGSTQGSPNLIYTFKFDCVNKVLEQI